MVESFFKAVECWLKFHWRAGPLALVFLIVAVISKFPLKAYLFCIKFLCNVFTIAHRRVFRNLIKTGLIVGLRVIDLVDFTLLG